MLQEIFPFRLTLDAVAIAGASLWSLALYWGFSPVSEWVMEQLNRWFNFAERSLYTSEEEFERTRRARESQNAFYAKNADEAFLRTALVQEKMKLEKQKIDFIIVHYRDVIKDPEKEIRRVKEFIVSDAAIDKAVQFVNPGAYRFDRDKIVAGL